MANQINVFFFFPHCVTLTSFRTSKSSLEDTVVTKRTAASLPYHVTSIPSSCIPQASMESYGLSQTRGGLGNVVPAQ